MVLLSAMCALGLAASCIASAPQQQEAPPPTGADYELELRFEKGGAPVDNIIHVAWIENRDESFFKYIFTSERLDYTVFTGNSGYSNIRTKATCPYWRKSLYETTLDDGIDAVSGPTRKPEGSYTGFSSLTALPEGSPSRFTAYFEIDRSFDGNDWWNDQPAILYSADVDLSGGEAQKTIALTARGWSRNAGGGSGGNENQIAGNPPASTIGALQAEMRYITRKAASGGTAFGDAYAAGSASDATNMTASLTLTATRQ